MELQLIIDKHLQLSFVEQLDVFVISQHQQQQLNRDIERLIKGEPIAYVVGFAEFYGLQFNVEKEVLIPRSDTEALIEWVLSNTAVTFSGSVLDMGCGSGAIAISIKKHRSAAEVTAIDVNEKALALTQINARKNQTEIECIKSNWFSNIDKSFDLIVSNPPYIAEDDPHIPALQYEPRSALIADNQGYTDIEKITSSARKYLCDKGMLIIEHGHNQANRCMQLLIDHGYSEIYNHPDLSGRSRFCTAIR